MHWIRREWTRAIAALFLGLIVGCNHPGSDILPPLTSIESNRAGQITSPVDGEHSARRADIRDEISVATWNIQVFGRSKISEPEVMEVIIDMVRLFSGVSTPEFTGAAGIIDLESEYALTAEQALNVSDHLPVWATFAPVEGARVAEVAGESVLR